MSDGSFMYDTVPLKFPPKLNYSVEQLREENIEKYDILMGAIARASNALFDTEGEKDKFRKSTELCIRNGLVLPSVDVDAREGNRIVLLMWSYYDGIFKPFSEMRHEELDIHACILEGFDSVN